MKNIHVIIFSLTFTVVACNDDFLELSPLDQITDETFWNSASEIKTYANQFYPDLANTLAFFDDDRSDNHGPVIRNSYVWGESVVPSSGGGWTWSKIRSCNFALVRIANMEQTSETLLYEGEIRFFKSFYYFQKVKQFGEVPWLDRDLQTDSEELFAPRDSRETIIANIMFDLDFAIANLPETSSDDRLNKYAAYALKAEVGLYEGTFRKYHDLGDFEELLRTSAEASEAIINSGLFSLYSTGNPDTDFFDLFTQYELKGNVEGIMIQRFLTDIRMHNQVRNMDEARTGYTKDFAESFLAIDGLPISLSPLYEGDAEFDDEFENRDPRMLQSIYNSSRPFRIFEDGTTFYKPLPEFSTLTSPTSYIILKGFSQYERDRDARRTIIDTFIYRFGKALLDYAEAKAELGECTQEVLDITINRLRDRVGMPHLTVDVGFVDPNWPNWEVPVTPLINEIRRERRIELCGEGKRWDDLVRWRAGKLLENKKTLLGARDPNSGGEYKELYPGTEREWDDKLYLQPLPLEDLALNTNLIQNPGW